MQKHKNAQKDSSQKEIKRTFLGYYQDMISQTVGCYYGPNTVARLRTKNGEYEELLNIRAPTQNFFSVDAFAVKSNQVDIQTWMRIAGYEQRYLLVVHGWMELAAEECRRELFHTFVIDCGWDDRFRIVSEVRRLGNSEPLSEPTPETTNAPEVENHAPRVEPPAVPASVSASSPSCAVPAQETQGSQGSGSRAHDQDRQQSGSGGTWASMAGRLATAPGELRPSKQQGFATETATPSKTLSRLWVTPPDVTEEELWEIFVDYYPESMINGRPEQDFRVEKSGDGGRWSGAGSDRQRSYSGAQRTFLLVPEECASKLVAASRQRSLRTKTRGYVKLDWAREKAQGRQDGKKGKKGGKYDYWD